MKEFIRKYRHYFWLTFVLVCIIMGIVGIVVWLYRFDVMFELFTLIFGIIAWFFVGIGRRV